MNKKKSKLLILTFFGKSDETISYILFEKREQGEVEPGTFSIETLENMLYQITSYNRF